MMTEPIGDTAITVPEEDTAITASEEDNDLGAIHKSSLTKPHNRPQGSEISTGA